MRTSSAHRIKLTNTKCSLQYPSSYRLTVGTVNCYALTVQTVKNHAKRDQRKRIYDSRITMKQESIQNHQNIIFLNDSYVYENMSIVSSLA
jgi:hypothetical protein